MTTLESAAVDAIETAQAVLNAEAHALLEISKRLNSEIGNAVDLILRHKGKVVITGMGKSGHVAQKIAATLSSTGTPAVFLHPAEAVHGDLGIYNPGDPTIVLSKSGTTAEIMRLIPTLRQFNSPIIAIVSNQRSPIAEKSDVVLDAEVSREADPLGIVPTSSALASMAMGDALASVLMKARGFQEKDFARLHPAGQLGRNLLLSVSEVMHKADRIAKVSIDMPLKNVVEVMTDYSLGAACVVNDEGKLLGIITDGDIRRVVLNAIPIDTATAKDIMTVDPIHATPEMMLADAIKLMEDRPSQISVLPVINSETNQLHGLLRIHDVYQPSTG